MRINGRRALVMNYLTYTPLEYIQSNGQCYIETGVLNKDVAIEMHLVTQVKHAHECLWCSRDDWQVNTFSAFVENGNTLRVDIVDTLHNIMKVKDKMEMVIGCNNGVVKVNGSIMLNEVPKKFTNYNYITLLDSRKGSDTPITDHSNNANFWLKGCKIWQGSTLVRDFVPALKLRTEAGLLDRVSGDFYTSPNGEKFNYKL